jgi:hypothetical protein
MESLFTDGKELQPWWQGRSWRFWLTVLSPLLLMGACGLFWVKAKHVAAAAEREAAVFHQLLAAGQYDAIYDNAAPAFRSSLNRYDSAKLLATVHIKMGECKTPSRALTFFTNASTSGTSVQLRYHLACANGALDEALVYVDTDFGPRLVRFDFRSPALLTQ